jgi:putative ABC transport system substrate-binding protein
VLCALLGAASLAAQPRKVQRIGILEIVPAAANAANLDAFRQALRELGHIEGQNLAIEYRSSDGRAERLFDLATELVRLEVNLIVTRGTQAALAARHATETIPIVMSSSGDPAAEGVVASLSKPGGNVTGFHMMVPPELGSRRLQILKEALPRVSRVGVLWNPADHHSPLVARETDRAARAMAVQIKSLEVQRPDEMSQAFEAALYGQVDAFVVTENSLTFADRHRIVEFAAMSRLPAMYGLREFVDAGGLMSYGVDRRDLYRRAAVQVDRILKGARPADMPIEPPLKFELAINLKTARALGLTIPPSLLRRADHVVE